MQVDIILDARASSDQLAELGALAETLGFRSLWVSSLLDARDPFVNFTTLAQSTDAITIGVIAANPYDVHPVKLATSLLTLNEMSNGRARLVVGGGGEALQALGIAPERRVRAVRECIEIIKSARPWRAAELPGRNVPCGSPQTRLANANSHPPSTPLPISNKCCGCRLGYRTVP